MIKSKVETVNKGYINGSLYFFNAKKLISQQNLNFTRTSYYLMSEKYSIDIDTNDDWMKAEQYL